MATSEPIVALRGIQPGSSRAGIQELLVTAAKAGALYVPVAAFLFAVLVPVHAFLLEQHLGARTLTTMLVFFIGGFAGGSVSWILSAVFARSKAWSVRFCIALIAHALLVPLATAFVFFLQYRLYFAQWHGPAFSEIWFWQMGFTGAAAIYLFMVSAVQYIFPLGFAVLIGVSALFCKWSECLDNS